MKKTGIEMPLKSVKRRKSPPTNPTIQTKEPPEINALLPNKVNILGVNFPILDYQDCLSLFEEWIVSRKSHQVCIANVHTVVTSIKDKELRDINNYSLPTMDGLPLIWYARSVHKAHIKERVCGPELMLSCLDKGRVKGWKHFFFGSTETILSDLVNAMQSRYPGVDIVGWHSPPFRPLSDAEDKQIIDLINQHQPDFLWVGLGAPKQEKWIASHLPYIHAPVQIGVGAAFDFHSGHVRRAPVWMQKSGFEWLYRISQDPRLIKRYCSTNPVYLVLFFRDYLKNNFFRKFRG
jgi:N-acetylglucosaminyldiphosphoundecaprenol N-acetyl-beta-D-mannosaminyltransferase